MPVGGIQFIYELKPTIEASIYPKHIPRDPMDPPWKIHWHLKAQDQHGADQGSRELHLPMKIAPVCLYAAEAIHVVILPTVNAQAIRPVDAHVKLQRPVAPNTHKRGRPKQHRSVAADTSHAPTQRSEHLHRRRGWTQAEKISAQVLAHHQQQGDGIVIQVGFSKDVSYAEHRVL